MTELYRLSSIYLWHRTHGAQFRTQAGWMEVEHYGDPAGEIASAVESVGICDASSMTKIDIQGRDTTTFLEHYLGARLPALNSWSNARIMGTGPQSDSVLVLRLHSERVLLLDGPTFRETRVKQLSEAARPFSCAHVIDLTSAYAAVHVVGPKSVHLLRKLCPGNLDEKAFALGSCMQAPFAKVAAIVIRADLVGSRAFYVLTSRDYGEYAWSCMLSAGQEYHVRPFGTTAEARLSAKEQTNVATI